MYSAVTNSAIQDGIYVLKKACMHFTTSLRSFPNVPLTGGGLLSSFQAGSLSTSSSHATLLQVINGVMSMAQAPQHFRPFKMPTTCDGCFACQSMCSVNCKLQIQAKLVTSQVKNPHDLQLDDWFTHLFKSTMGYCRCRT